jgi:hypothetical protein
LVIRSSVPTCSTILISSLVVAMFNPHTPFLPLDRASQAWMHS